MALESVLSPTRIGGVELRNRVARTAHQTGYAHGTVTDRLIAYHLARARGEVGLTILETAAVHPSSPAGLLAYTDDIVEGWAKLTDAVHAEGMKVFQQLWHGGHNSSPLDGGPPWAPSGVPGYPLVPAYAPPPPTPMTPGMIQEVVSGFADAARRVVVAGLDGIEVHAAHGYLLAQFLSPRTNHRDDEYGGPLENRMRLTVEILRAVRAVVPDGFPVGVRLSAAEYVPGGLTTEDSTEIARRLEQLSLIDFLDLSSGVYQSADRFYAGRYEPHRYMMDDSAQVGAESTVPRIVTGRFLTLDEADQEIGSGRADIVSMVRATIADAHHVRRRVTGSAPRPCIGCNQGCVAGLLLTAAVGCTVNPTVGAEQTLDDADLGRAEQPRKVTVVGAGPAGLEAARVAATRGHRVTVLEAAEAIGGKALLAAGAPGYADLAELLRWYRDELERLGVRLRTGHEVAPGDPELRTADAVVIAVGRAVPARIAQSRFPQLDLADDALHTRVVDSLAVLKWEVQLSGHAVVLDDAATPESVAVADALLARGLTVTIVTPADQPALALAPTMMHGALLRRLCETEGLDVITNRVVTDIGKNEITLAPVAGGASMSVAADVVVPVVAGAPNDALARELRSSTSAYITVIGDARTPRDLLAAIHSGFTAGTAL